MCGAVFSVLFIYLLNQRFTFAWILNLNGCKRENMWTWKRIQEEHVVETVCCPTKPKILISSRYIEKSAYSCIEPLLICSRTLCYQHTAQCLEFYILSACQTELNDWWISWEKSGCEWSQFPFAFSRKLAFQNRTQNVCCLEHTSQLTQIQQPMSKNSVIKWPKAASSYTASSKASRSALSASNRNERNLGWRWGRLCVTQGCY